MSRLSRARRLAPQRGAAAVFVALGLVSVIAAAALALDLGRLYLAQRDLQRMANLAALDVIGAVGGCVAPERDRYGLAQQLARASLQRNGADDDWLAADGLRLGRVRHEGGIRRFVASDDPQGATAAELRLSRPMPPRLFALPGGDGRGRLSAVAAAQQAPIASMVVNPSPPAVAPLIVELLDNALGGAAGRPGLDGGSLLALQQAPVQLTDIIPASASQEDLTAFIEEPRSTPHFLDRLAQALIGFSDSAAAAMQDTAGSSDGMNDFIPGDVIVVPDEYDQIGSAVVPAFELARGVIRAAGDQVPTLMPPFEYGVPVEVTVDVDTITPGRIAVGPAREVPGGDYATTATGALATLDVGLRLESALLGSTLNLALQLDLAPARATLQRIWCASRDRREHAAEVGVDSGLGVLRIKDGAPLVEVERNLDLGALSLPLRIAVTARGEVQLTDPQVSVLQFDGPFPYRNTGRLAAANTQSTRSRIGRSLDQAIYELVDGLEYDIDVELAGLDSGLHAPALEAARRELQNRLVPALRTELVPLLLTLDEALLRPAAQALGADFPGATVSVYDVHVPRAALIGDR